MAFKTILSINRNKRFSFQADADIDYKYFNDIVKRLEEVNVFKFGIMCY